ncbi:MAG: YIP1 family protein [Anaerolineae bacterium]|nr:YIP1 family protein [Anaerolineae bacterium]
MSFFQKLFGLLFRPRETIEKIEPVPREIYLIVAAALLVKGYQAWVDIPLIFKNFDLAHFVIPFNAILSFLFYWVVITFIFHLSSFYVGGEGDFSDLLKLTSYSLFPYILALIASTIFIVMAPVWFPMMSDQNIRIIQTTMEEGGLLWGLRGVLAYFSVQRVHKISAERALLTAVIINFFVIAYNLYASFSGNMYRY